MGGKKMSKDRSFPVLGFLLLIFAATWFLREMNVIDIDLPWLPVILIVVAIGIIFNRLR